MILWEEEIMMSERDLAIIIHPSRRCHVYTHLPLKHTVSGFTAPMLCSSSKSQTVFSSFLCLSRFSLRLVMLCRRSCCRRRQKKRPSSPKPFNWDSIFDLKLLFFPNNTYLSFRQRKKAETFLFFHPPLFFLQHWMELSAWWWKKKEMLA